MSDVPGVTSQALPTTLEIDETVINIPDEQHNVLVVPKFAIGSRKASSFRTKVSAEVKKVDGMDQAGEEDALKASKMDQAAEEDSLKALNEATFFDMRWENALRHLHGHDVTSCRARAEALLRRGAKEFGMWALSDETVSRLTAHLMGEKPGVSAPLEAWISQLSEVRPAETPDSTASHNSMLGRFRRREALFKSPYTKYMLVLSLLVFVASNLYALDVCLVKYPGAVEIFGWPLYFARACAMGALLWTALLFLFMARTVFRALPICLHTASDAHKEIHVFCAQCLALCAVVHVGAHLVGTLPGIMSSTPEELNRVLGCADPDGTKGYLKAKLRGLVFPPCPLTERYTYLDVVFRSTPGLTGLALLALLGVLGHTARQESRRAHPDRFWYVHNAVIPLWLLLLFCHGANGWVGVGFPLVVFVCSLPVALWATDRVGRNLRFYFGGSRIVMALTRPGKSGLKGALTQLSISKPRYLWPRSTPAATYGFLCMPEYAPLQWHPFTICSGEEDETIDFIIASVGDWTEELARRCLEALSTDCALPALAVDGPYPSPSSTALTRDLVVAVGAGVGVTPMLSILATIVAGHRHRDFPVKEAHFFWMTRSADEFLFGRKLFTRIAASARLQGRVFLHLHVTASVAKNDAASFLFREAVRRQSQIDQKAFTAAREARPNQSSLPSLQVPQCWVDGAMQDVLWERSLVETGDESYERETARMHEGHWSVAVAPTPVLKQEISKRSRTTGFFGSERSTTGGLSVCSDRSNGSGHTSRTSGPRPSERASHLPVVFGRPSYEQEIRAIGRRWFGFDIHVYVCGNDVIVQSLTEICERFSGRTEDRLPRQRYCVHFERFG